MGLPSINITFKEKGISAIKRNQRGIVCLLVHEKSVHELTRITVYGVDDIPESYEDKNKEQIELALRGYQLSPAKIEVVAVPALESEEELNDAKLPEYLKALENVKFTYLAIPEIKSGDVDKVASWIKTLRTQKDIKAKAVLPNCAADNEGVINYTNNTNQTKTKTYTAAEYCARIAGLIAGTPLLISCTYAPLPELVACDKHTKEELDSKIDNGELCLMDDGEKIKIARGVNSFKTTIEGKGDSFKKIKVVDIMDLIHDDIKKTAQDSYLGKYANKYANRCLLISAITGYLLELEDAGLLEEKQNSVEINLKATKIYLLKNGRNTKEELEKMNDQTLKVQNVRDNVFLTANVSILDAIENIELPINI